MKPPLGATSDQIGSDRFQSGDKAFHQPYDHSA